jgi:MFS family permease
MKRLFVTYYVINLLVSAAMGLTSAMYVTFMIERGLNLFEAQLSNAFFFLAVFLFEIPTGVFADRFKKKYSTMIGCLVTAIGLYVLGASMELLQFILGEVIVALGVAFLSGAGDAWFTNESKLLGYDYESNRTHIMKRVAQLKIFFGVLSGFLGSLLADHYSQLPWTLSSLLFVFIFFVASTMKEDWTREDDRKMNSKMLFLESCKIVRGKPQLIFIIQVSAFFMFGIMTMNMLWQPFLNRASEGYTFLGYAWVIMGAIYFCGATIAPQVHRFLQKEEKTLIWMIACIGISILAMVISPYGIALGILMGYQVFRGVYGVIHSSYVQGHVSDEYRATMGSTISVVNTLAGFFGLIVSGLLSKFFSIEVAWTLSAGVFLGATWFLSRTASRI